MERTILLSSISRHLRRTILTLFSCSSILFLLAAADAGAPFQFFSTVVFFLSFFLTSIPCTSWVNEGKKEKPGTD